MQSLCFGWEFTPAWSENFPQGKGSFPLVDIPHNVQPMPLHYADSESYQMLCGYRKALEIPLEYRQKRLFLQFDGAAHIATVYVNGKELATHCTGYTGFRVEITQAVRFGETNLISVRLDTSENPATPPFGGVVDYLTFGGIYREVWLDVRSESYISDIFVTTPTLTRLKATVTADGEGDFRYRAELLEDGQVLASLDSDSPDILLEYPQAKPWNLDDPQRYDFRVSLLQNGAILDEKTIKVGFRTLEFRENSFLLNGKPVFLRGLNRHQCWPYVGYAMPESMQREDARILKEELGCTVVRTSHYPQSHHFIDECDRLGLLVLTEIPGWQHIGDTAWQDQAVENVREMILQYRNHPSIITWGVRINESPDLSDFYRRTNALARQLDPSRPTHGVRCITGSELLEDIYTYNDFVHRGTNPGVTPKKRVTKAKKPLLITEHSGHMFPTKSFDTWQRRQEHALRHARVQSDAVDGNHLGCIGWCMFDYATHKDFGSGDRICYHGVLDSFRNPKLAASLYASQKESAPVLTVTSSMDIGDYPGGDLGMVYVLTNAEKVALYKNGTFISWLEKADYPGLHHPPMMISDTIGDLLKNQEDLPEKKAKLLKKALLTLAKYGLGGMPLKAKLLIAWAMLRSGLGYKEGMALYGKYIGNWGGEATQWRLDAMKGDQVVTSVTCGSNTQLQLEAKASSLALRQGDTYDAAAVRVRVLDGHGNIAPYAQAPINITLEGSLELIGPNVVTAEGGMTGLYVKTTGQTGPAKLTLSSPGLAPITLYFSVE